MDFLTPNEYNSAILAARSAMDSSIVLKPLREPRNGLTSRKSSNIVLCTIRTSQSRASKAESSFSAIPSPSIRLRNDGVSNTIPARDFANPLSISRSKEEHKGTSFSLTQIVTPFDSSKSCSHLSNCFQNRKIPWQCCCRSVFLSAKKRKTLSANYKSE